MKRWAVTIIAVFLLSAFPLLFIESPVFARVTAVAAVCLYLWISETTPPFVPTLVLWALIPLVLGHFDPKYSLAHVLSWAVDPVMALFFGGFTLGIATQAFGLDKRMARFAFRRAGRSFPLFLLLIIVFTAFLSMWLSNIGAAALILACLRPVLKEFGDDHLMRRTLLIGVALGADLGGIATPIGTGPNAIAIAFLAPVSHVSFINWMAFALPLTVGMLFLGFGMLWWRTRSISASWTKRDDNLKKALSEAGEGKDPAGQAVFLGVLVITALLWLTEPLHGIPSSVVAIGSAAFIFLTGMLSKKDLTKLDWSTLILIAGGITLGRLFEQSGLIKAIAANVPFGELDPRISLFVLCLASALLASLMSNTATAVLLIPLASALIPYPSTAILIAVSASFGIPFVISTPQNAMAFGEGGVRFGDMFWPGIVLMIVGCLVVSLTGRAVLNFAGFP
ncbi:MAG: DASS family sodium-coupled anion symporter [Pyrinomonadaceae bacterium]